MLRSPWRSFWGSNFNRGPAIGIVGGVFFWLMYKVAPSHHVIRATTSVGKLVIVVVAIALVLLALYFGGKALSKYPLTHNALVAVIFAFVVFILGSLLHPTAANPDWHPHWHLGADSFRWVLVAVLFMAMIVCTYFMYTPPRRKQKVAAPAAPTAPPAAARV